MYFLPEPYNRVAPLILTECRAKCRGSLPILLTTKLKALVASSLLKLYDLTVLPKFARAACTLEVRGARLVTRSQVQRLLF